MALNQNVLDQQVDYSGNNISNYHSFSPVTVFIFAF